MDTDRPSLRRSRRALVLATLLGLLTAGAVGMAVVGQDDDDRAGAPALDIANAPPLLPLLSLLAPLDDMATLARLRAERTPARVLASEGSGRGALRIEGRPVSDGDAPRTVPVAGTPGSPPSSGLPGPDLPIAVPVPDIPRDRLPNLPVPPVVPPVDNLPPVAVPTGALSVSIEDFPGDPTRDVLIVSVDGREVERYVFVDTDTAGLADQINTGSSVLSATLLLPGIPLAHATNVSVEPAGADLVPVGGGFGPPLRLTPRTGVVTASVRNSSTTRRRLAARSTPASAGAGAPGTGDPGARAPAPQSGFAPPPSAQGAPPSAAPPPQRERARDKPPKSKPPRGKERGPGSDGPRGGEEKPGNSKDDPGKRDDERGGGRDDDEEPGKRSDDDD